MNSLLLHSFPVSRRTFAILNCAGFLTTLCITSAAETSASNPSVASAQELSVVKSKIQRHTKDTLIQAQAAYSNKIAAVENALSNAKEKKTIKPSTEAYYREVLARFLTAWVRLRTARVQ